jgi:hypothetical protein
VPSDSWSCGLCRPRSSSNDDDEFSLPQLSRGSHASSDDSSKSPLQDMLSDRESSISGVCFIMERLYNTFSAKIKALWRYKSVAPAKRVKAVKSKEKTDFISRLFRDSAKNTFQTYR